VGGHLAALAGRHTAPQDDQMTSEWPEARRQPLEMVLALGEKDGRATLREDADHVIEDEPAEALRLVADSLRA
jgi:hypothetical protein